MVNAQCSMFNAQCSMFNAQCSMLNVQCSMFTPSRASSLLPPSRPSTHVRVILPAALSFLPSGRNFTREAGDVGCGGELVLALCADALDVHVERAQAVDVNAVRVAQLVLDDLGKLPQTRRRMSDTFSVQERCMRSASCSVPIWW